MSKPEENGSKPNSLVFIPNLFKINTSKVSVVNLADPFITDDTGKEYCSLLSENKDKLPSYFQHYKKFTDNVLDIPSSIFADIAKTHIEREAQFMEEEKKEEENLMKVHNEELMLKKNLDHRITQILQSKEHYVKRSCPVKIPFKSTLNHEEHEFYLRAFIKYQMRPPTGRLEEKEYEQYMSMQNRVFDEQSCMMNFSFKVAQLTMKYYNTVPHVINNYISNYVAHRSKRAFSYSQYYKNEVQIPLKPQESSSISDHFQLVHIGHLLSLGWVPKLKLPNKRAEVKLPMDDSVAIKNKTNLEGDFDRSRFLHKCAVSEDPNAEYLAKMHGVSIVMSTSVLRTIVDNQEQTFEKEWNIPVRIRTVKTIDKNGKEVESRIVFLDKPLVKKCWLPLQKKTTFFKAAAKVALTRYDNQFYCRLENRFPPCNTSDETLNDTTDITSLPPSVYRQNKKRKKKRQSYSPSVDIANDLLLSEDEENEGKIGGLFTAASPVPSSSHSDQKESGDESALLSDAPNRQSTSSPKPISQNSPSSPPPQMKPKEAGGLLEDLLDRQETFLKPKCTTADASLEELSLPQMLNRCDVNPKQHTKGSIWANRLPTDWSDHQVRLCKYGAGTNYHYQLFSFERTEQSPVKDERVEPLRILIRHNINGLSLNFKKERKPYVIFPKLENQVYFGCEVNSISEIVQQWAALVTRPNVTLLQVRLCVDSGVMVMTEEKTLETVLKEGKQNHLNFNPQTAYSTLNVLFNTLKKMSSGDYILHHSPKTEAFMILLKSCKSETSMYPSCLDLHTIYSEGSVTSRFYKNPPWLAIDTHVITPFHKFHRKIPGTFPMQNIEQLNKLERRKRREKASKKIVLEGYE